MQPTAAEEQLRQEFNRAALDGRGDGMEQEHSSIAAHLIELVDLRPNDVILDVGCGTGWLARRLAAQLPRSRVVGIDLADQMLKRAAELSTDFTNVTFLRGAAERIPEQEHSFTKVFSIESAYYWPDPGRGLAEIFRVLRPGGSVWILIAYYRDNPHCHQWAEAFTVPAHLLGADEWAGLLRGAGFARVAHRRVPDDAPAPEVYTGRWFRDAAQYRAFRQQGALLVGGRKP